MRKLTGKEVDKEPGKSWSEYSVGLKCFQSNILFLRVLQASSDYKEMFHKLSSSNRYKTSQFCLKIIGIGQITAIMYIIMYISRVMPEPE
jgi:hypothetical protein